MAQQQGKSGLAAKYGAALAKAVEAHKNEDSVSNDGGELPAGIENGVAQLKDVKFGVYETGKHQGEYFFRAAGICVSPKMHDGVVCEGKFTSIMEPMCDTPERSKRKTMDDHVQWVLMMMRSLGVKTTSISANNLEAMAATLKASQVYFSFRTWKGQKATEGPYKDQEPRVQHQWGKAIPDYVPGDDSDSGLNDGSGGSDNGPPSGNGAVPPAAPRGRAKAAPASAATAATPRPVGRPPKAAKAAEAFDETNDLNSLVAKATAGDLKAGKSLTKMAMDKGFTEEEVNNTENWEQVLEMIENGKTEDDEDQSDTGEDAPFVPEVGDVFQLEVEKKDHVTKKKVKEVIEIRVDEVDEDARELTVTALDGTDTRYEKVRIDSLYVPETA